MNEPTALQLADTIRQTAFEAHTFLRHGYNEKVYENSLRNRLRKRGLSVEQQVSIAVHDEDGSPLGEFLADLVVNQEFIIELKAVRTLVEEHTAQVLGYLRASRLEHGMLINFGSPRIQFHKYIFRQGDRFHRRSSSPVCFAPFVPSVANPDPLSSSVPLVANPFPLPSFTPSVPFVANLS